MTRRSLALSVTGVVLVALAVGAALEVLPWDGAITEAAVRARTPARDDIALGISRLGSTPVVVAVSLSLAGLAWRRSRALAFAVLAIAFARPLLEFGLKEVVGRERPVGHRLVRGEGPSFPSSHPFAVAASWGLVPYVIPRRCLRVVWLFIPAVAASRVWLGVHWTSDAIAGSLLGIVGLALLDRHLRRAAVRSASARPGMLTG